MKEFLVTNINGSYANMGINGELARMYAGYLVISLTPPQDRAVVLEWIDEYICDGTDLRKSNIYRTNSIPGAGPAEYGEDGYIPRMHSVSDLLDLTRNVVMLREEEVVSKTGESVTNVKLSETGESVPRSDAGHTHPDCVKIVYDCKNLTDHDITLVLEPRLTFRRPETILKIENPEFEKLSESLDVPTFPANPDGTPQFVDVPSDVNSFRASFAPKKGPYPNIPCEIMLMAKAENATLSVASNGSDTGCFTEASRYTKDEETGERGVELRGTCYVPYKFRTVIPADSAATVSILCEAHRTEKGAEMSDSAVERFFNTPLKTLRESGEAAYREALRLADFEKIKAKFADSHPETVELYKELVLSASKFITKKTGTSYKTVMAGYPWFLDWGRDTMIAFTGLLLVTGRFDTARDVLRSFAKYVRNGMVPNVFPSGSADEPQYNTVDASLWFFYAADMYARFSGDEAFVKTELYPVLTQIAALYTRTFDEMQAASAEAFCYGIYMDDDGFVHAGTDESDQLTWMDVRIDGKAVTLRHDCPVEIQALMYNALNVMIKFAPGSEKNTSNPGTQVSGNSNDALLTRYRALSDKLKKNAQIFLNTQKKCLYDYVEGVPGHRLFNDQIRPNQIWAVSLPYTMFDRSVCVEIMNTVREQLVTDLGIRSLAPSEQGYIGKYEGDLRSRDRAYHNGTAWGFLAGPYIIACLKVFGNSPENMKNPEKTREEASQDIMEYLHNLLLPYLDHMQNDGCIYGIAEVFDGDAPKNGKGCYNQAWSVGCLLEAIYEMAR